MDFTKGKRDIFETSKLSSFKDEIKACVFDLDGTLVDSIGQIVACTKEAFKQLDLAIPNDKDIQSIIGKSLEDGLRFLLPDDRKKDSAKVTKWYREIFIENDQYNKQIVFDGVEDLLISLKKNDYKLAIASGRSTIGIERALSTTFLGNYVDCFCAGDEVPSKPHPQMVYEVAKRLNLETKNLLGVGDTNLDIELFLNADSKACAVQTGVWSGDAMLTLNPHLTIPHVKDLKDLLK